MGYQALLFCTDEKLARVVSQLFSELEFAVSPVSDPFAAVKNLLAQHYDAVVIDCENEQSASLMIKSARNSTFNQGSLAIGLVEGQAGVAKAYRMGANLVLTKPINVEAAKGTLRVARGLLRKGTETTTGHQGAITSGSADAHAPGSSFASTNHGVGASSAASASSASGAASQYRSGENSSETSTPAAPYPAFAKSEPMPALTPAVPMKPWTSIGSTVPVAHVPAAAAQMNLPQPWARPEAPETVAAKIEPPKPAATPIVNAQTRSHSAAAAPAPAKIATPPQEPAYEEEQDEFADDAFLSRANFPASGATIQSPSFSMETEHGGGSGGSQKILIGVIAVLLVIGGYFGWLKFGQSDPAPAPVATAPQAPPVSEPSRPAATSAQTLPPATNYSSAAATPSSHTDSLPQAGHSPISASPTAQTSSPRNPAAQTSTKAAVSSSSGTTQTAALFESTGTKAAPTPILVKPGTSLPTHAQTQNQTEQASAQPPSPLGVAAPANSELKGVLASAPAPARPSLARIRLSQGVSQGLLIKRVEPEYPRNALATHTQGVVQIEATVDKEGHVVNPKVLSGPFLLAPAALEAVRQWRYKPYYLDGEPVEVQTQITINFKVQ
ncbi:MAG: TonB family protein [Terriglobales bacterium]